MNRWMQIRDYIRAFLSAYETLVLRVFKGVMAFIALMVINANFGYAEVLDHIWIAVAVALICAFVSASAYTLLLGVYLFIQLVSLSLSAAFVELALFLVAFVLCAIYHGRHLYHLAGTPVLYQMHIPFAMPVLSALYGTVNEVITVLCGGVLAYYLKSVKDHAAQFADAKESITVSELLVDGMLSNTMFYVFLTALLALFLVCYVLRMQNIPYSWMVGLLAGVLAEFIILLAGYLILHRTSQIPWLIGGNLITLALGLAVGYTIYDLDYVRTEKVQFEDDEYYYYVTAVPKARLERETKEVKKITGGDPSVRHSRMSYTRHRSTKKRKRSSKG